jgi:hypothetical protein
MRLKILTTAFVLAGIGLLVLWPWLVGHRPDASESRLALASYGQRLLVYFAVTALTWLGAAFCAWLLIRQTRREYVESLRENVQSLIEGSLRDHGRK